MYNLKGNIFSSRDRWNAEFNIEGIDSLKKLINLLEGMLKS
jgi:hypothetical protein